MKSIVLKLFKKKNLYSLYNNFRWAYRKFCLVKVDYKGKKVSDVICDYLKSPVPCMICRFGSVELSAVRDIQLVNEKKKKFKKSDFKFLKNNAGFFPIDIKQLKRFRLRMIEDMKEIDLYGQFALVELLFKKYLTRTEKVMLTDLDPWLYSDPWTKALEGKKVLVVYPFEKTIKKQYKNRTKIWKNKKILPKFELITLKAVQSIGGESDKFKSWFEALNYMENKINSIDFDIAVIGCGAYGLPLAAHVKRIGKKAIHLGGSTQVLFGIIGKRWETEYDFKDKYFNNYWVRPLDSEKPKGYKKVEDGCYW
jgi:hypothetical protein